MNDTINLLPPAGSGFENLTSISFARLVSAGIQIVMIIAVIILFFVLIIGGITVMTSGGNAQKQASGSQAVTSAIIGLIIIFGAWAIIQLIEIFFDVNILGGLNVIM